VKISEAKGKLRIGMRVRSNGNGAYVGYVYDGVITHIEKDRFTVKRDDGEYGEGFNSGWFVRFESEGFITILSENTMVDITKARFGVSYCEFSDKVYEYFENRKDAEKRVDELSKDKGVTNIVLFEVGKKWKLETPVEYKLVEVK